MRIATTHTEVYKYDELSERAKENAYNQWYEWEEYGWFEENKQSLYKFAEAFGIHIKDYEYGLGYPGYVRWDYNHYLDQGVLELTGIRLATYIYNNFWELITRGKYYSKGSYVDGKYTYKSRRSRIIRVTGDCPFTGYCMDDNLLDPIFEFMKDPTARPSVTLEDLLDECVESWIDACVRDMEDYFSQEHFEEEVEQNEWEFTERGERWNG